VKTEGQKQSQRHERRLEKVLGGKRTAASGAFWSRKGDVRNERFLLEHKWTGNKSFSLKAAELEKITKEAIMDGRTPAFGISLNNRNYILLTEDDFVELAGLDDD
jgi:hypothetical protein